MFWQTENEISKISILFQSMMSCAIGSMLMIVQQFPNRSIYYKQDDANFFPTWTYVAGRSVASIPTALSDALIYGTIVYWFTGLAFNDGASFANFIVFLILLFTMSIVSGLLFSVFSAAIQNITIAQACMAVTTVMFILFSGFTVQPDVIPP